MDEIENQRKLEYQTRLNKMKETHSKSEKIKLKLEQMDKRKREQEET